jgi:hypothetical protein
MFSYKEARGSQSRLSVPMTPLKPFQRCPIDYSDINDTVETVSAVSMTPIITALALSTVSLTSLTPF